MEYNKLTEGQRGLIKECIKYDADADYNGRMVPSLADRVIRKFGMENTTKIMSMTEKDLEYYDIITSKSYQNIMQGQTRRKLKRVLGRLKKERYETNYSPNMSTTEMWDCYFDARKDILNL